MKNVFCKGRAGTPLPAAARTECEPYLPTSLPRRGQAGADDAVDELRVARARLVRGLREVLVGGEDGVRVGLDEIDTVVRRDAQVDARIAVQGEQPIDAFAGLRDVLGQRRVELGEAILPAP